jgi:hypothetical protein
MRGNDDDWVGARECGAGATRDAIARRRWENAGWPRRSRSLSYEGAKHSTLTAPPDDLEDFAVGFSYTKGNGAITARQE